MLLKSKMPELRSNILCEPSTCYFERYKIISLNKVGRFNPFTKTHYRDTAYYELGIDELEHLATCHNTLNRFMSKAHLLKITKGIIRLGFLESGDTIKISRDGVIIDGQNRIHSALKALKPNETIKVIVAFGLDPKINQRLPFPKARTIEDILEESNVPYELWKISLLKRINKYMKVSLNGTNIVKVFGRWESSMNKAMDYLDETKYKYIPSMKAPIFYQDIKVYTTLCKRLISSGFTQLDVYPHLAVLDALFNPKSEETAYPKLSKDIKGLVTKLEESRTHMTPYNRLMKVLCLAHQSVIDGLAHKHGISANKVWAESVVFGEGLKDLPEDNILFKLIEENKELWS